VRLELTRENIILAFNNQLFYDEAEDKDLNILLLVF